MSDKNRDTRTSLNCNLACSNKLSRIPISLHFISSIVIWGVFSVFDFLSRVFPYKGYKAALNSLIIDSSTITPYKIRTILGGINIPRVPPEAIDPYICFFCYPNFFISGIATEPMSAAVATLDPLIAENIVLARILKCNKPPGTNFNHLKIDT